MENDGVRNRKMALPPKSPPKIPRALRGLILTLMAKVAGYDEEPGQEDKDETLTELQKEYESEDYGKI